MIKIKCWWIFLTFFDLKLLLKLHVYYKTHYHCFSDSVVTENSSWIFFLVDRYLLSRVDVTYSYDDCIAACDKLGRAGSIVFAAVSAFGECRIDLCAEDFLRIALDEGKTSSFFKYTGCRNMHSLIDGAPEFDFGLYICYQNS